MSRDVEFLRSADVGHHGTTLLHNVDFALEPGTITRLVGANGVGKSTLIQSALGLLPLINGSWTFPHKPGSTAYQRAIGYMPSSVSGYPNLSLDNWFSLIASGYGVDRKTVDTLWNDLGGRGSSSGIIESLSSGNRKKSLFTCAAAIEREAIFLDEPFEEVDLYGQEVMAAKVTEQVSAGAAALIVSHRSVDHLLRVDRTWEIADGTLQTNTGIGPKTNPATTPNAPALEAACDTETHD